MENSYFKISMLFLALVTVSCSNDENIAIGSAVSKSQVALRPTVPLQNSKVKIGTQVWMTRNLNVSRYRNGDLIPQVTDPTQWANLTTGAWCYYSNNTANGTIYGKLYNWFAVNDPRGLAPVGWHIPTHEEWITLETFLGGESVAGGKLKAITLWASPNYGATNTSSFTGLPGGLRRNDGTFDAKGYTGIWWSASEFDSSLGWCFLLDYDAEPSLILYGFKSFAYSVRCVKD